MTMSYKSTPDPQEPGQQHPAGQPPQYAATQHPGNAMGSPMRMPDVLRPGGVTPTPPWNAGAQFIVPTQVGGPVNSVPVTPNPLPMQGSPDPSGHNQGNNSNPGPQPQVFVPPSGMPMTNGVNSQGWSPGRPDGGALQARQPAAVGAVPNVPHTPLLNPQSGSGLQGPSFPAVQPQPGIENGHVILYRSPNFFLRTVSRSGQL